MAQLVQLQVDLSPESIAFLHRKVESGEYASVSDVLAESINVLRDEDDERRRFEQEEVIPAHDEVMADLSSAIPIDEFRASLRSARAELVNAS